MAANIGEGAASRTPADGDGAGTPAQIPAAPELMRVDPQGPVLLGSRCSACGREYYPRRWVCATDRQPVEDIDLPREGRLHVATYVHHPAYGKATLDSAGYGVGQVDLEGGVRIQAILAGMPDHWIIDGLVRLESVVVQQDEQGRDVVLARFRAVTP